MALVRQQRDLPFVEIDYTLALHDVELIRKRTAVDTEVLRQLLTVHVDSEGVGAVSRCQELEVCHYSASDASA